MTQADQEQIIGRAHIALKSLWDEKAKLLESARVWGIELQNAGQALQSNPAALAFSDEEDAPANPKFPLRTQRGVFDAAALAALLQKIRTNREHIEQNERIVNG